MIAHVALPVNGLVGQISLPADKSIAHRVILLSALADGQSTFTLSFLAEDPKTTLKLIRALGVHWTLEAGILTIDGVGLKGLSSTTAPLDAQNAGTAARLLAGILCAQPFSSTLIGDASLSVRPMARVAIPLQTMGAKIHLSDDNTLPMHLQPATLQGYSGQLQKPSAQVKSAILLAGLCSQMPVRIEDTFRTRNHTELLLKAYGAPIEQQNNTIVLEPCRSLTPLQATLPGDPSAAAFWAVAGSVHPNAHIVCKNMSINPTRIAFVHALRQMGAQLELLNPCNKVEPTADLSITGVPQLNAIVLEAEHAASLIDEFPVLSIAAAFARGTSVFKGIEELRYKESNRLKAIITNLNACGVKAFTENNALFIPGGTFKGGAVCSFDDHRIAMAFLIAGTRAQDGVVLDDTRCCDISYPHFLKDLAALGGQIEPQGVKPCLSPL